jgi:hypothetical protein
VDFPIPKCRFCGNELVFMCFEPIDIQRWSCRCHYNSSSTIIPVTHFLYVEADFPKLARVEVELDINQSFFTWTIFSFEYCDTLTNCESGLVCGLIRDGEFITSQDFFASFYHQSPDKRGPEQMESELRTFNNE